MLILLGTFIKSMAQDAIPEVKSYTTNWVKGEAPRIDGLPNDPAWEQVEWGGGDFVQRSPDDGQAPSQQTKFKILYDAKNLYILVKALDDDPSKIVSRMSRRDGFDGDMIEVNIDSYFDKRTAFSFTASVSGVKGDEYVSNNGNNWDANWDPIWYLKTSIDEEGWIAEFRIPLSQLRFADKAEHVWGFQVMRHVFRKEERSNWQYIPQDAAGWVHLFGELKGIKGIKPQKQLEVQPYVVGQIERSEEEEGNPFVTGRSSNLALGLDAKIGITSDITLDLTVNPDFGQVEADPSQVNLTAFQLFFQERRPFFIEGNNILSFPIAGWDANNLFYSRRIGRRPQREIDLDSAEYQKQNSTSRILGAAKITGKNAKGFSWGILESVTAKEYATIDSAGHRREEVIEPFTNYLVARIQQDINQGNTVIGAMATSVYRNIDNDQLDFLRKEAYSAGIDLVHYWDERKYAITGRVLGSHVKGSPESLLLTQHSPERFFQRPDNFHTDIDTTRTSLSGTGGLVMLSKNSGKIIAELGYTWRSPGLELNDIGFMAQTDVMTQWIWMQYRKLNPFSVFRTMRINFTQWSDHDFGWNRIGEGLELGMNAQLKNYWFININSSINGRSVSNADLRGGPALHYPGQYQLSAYVNTDQRKALNIGFGANMGKGFESFQESWGLSMSFAYRPTNALNINISPSISFESNAMQFVEILDENDAPEYIVAKMDQTVYNISARLTYMLTPNLSLEYWGQPFAFAGKYSEFKRISSPDHENYRDRFISLNQLEVPESDLLFLDENNDDDPDFSIEKPDFNFVQFRSNMVMRWEYIPGSTLFLVWTQNRTDSPSLDHNTVDHLYAGLFGKTPQNIFLIKYTYRFVF